MPDSANAEDQISGRLAEGFRTGGERYRDVLLDTDCEQWLEVRRRRQLGEYHFGAGFTAEAVGLIAEQTLQRVGQDVEDLLNMLPEPIRGRDHAEALLLALFLSGRALASGAALKFGDVLYGDSKLGLGFLVIEPGIQISDFDVDFLLTYEEDGPNPRRNDDPSEPAGITAVARAALVCDSPKAVDYQEQILRRQALSKSLDIAVVSYTEQDVERDPFALTTRVVRDLVQTTSDDIYG